MLHFLGQLWAMNMLESARVQGADACQTCLAVLH